MATPRYTDDWWSRSYNDDSSLYGPSIAFEEEPVDRPFNLMRNSGGRLPMRRSSNLRSRPLISKANSGTPIYAYTGASPPTLPRPVLSRKANVRRFQENVYARTLRQHVKEWPIRREQLAEINSVIARLKGNANVYDSKLRNIANARQTQRMQENRERSEERRRIAQTRRNMRKQWMKLADKQAVNRWYEKYGR